MASVLLTRPLAASEPLARELKRHGYESIIEPLLVIEPLITPQPDLAEIRTVMITSANALSTGRDFSALFDLPCFCVGDRTASAACDAGFRKIASASGDGVELAGLITRDLKEKTAILHIAGQDIDSKAQDELTRLGYKIIVWPVYAARPVEQLNKRAIDLFKRQELDAVLVFSVRTAETLHALLERNGLGPCCERLVAIGLSEAVANALKPLPWKKFAAASAPTEDSMIDCLKRIFPVPISGL